MKYIIVVIFLTISLPSLAQNRGNGRDSLYQLVRNELLVQNQTVLIRDELLRLDYYFYHPIEINSAELSTLLSLPIIDFHTALKIVEFREKHGVILNPEELFSVIDIDSQYVARLIPFLYSSFSPTQGTSSQNRLLPNDKLSFRIIDSYPLSDERKPNWAGSFHANRINLDYQSQNGYSASFQGNKEAGEYSYTDNFSGSILIERLWNCSKIIIGDYAITTELGLLCSNSRQPDNLHPSSAVTDCFSGIEAANNAPGQARFRGTTSTFNLMGLSFSPFLSFRYFDSEPDISYPEGIHVIKYPRHCTLTEIYHHDNLEERAGGCMIKCAPAENVRLNGTASSSEIIYSDSCNKKIVYQSAGSLSALFLFRKHVVRTELAFLPSGISAGIHITIPYESNTEGYIMLRRFAAQMVVDRCSFNNHAQINSPSVQLGSGLAYSGNNYTIDLGSTCNWLENSTAPAIHIRARYRQHLEEGHSLTAEFRYTRESKMEGTNEFDDLFIPGNFQFATSFNLQAGKKVTLTMAALTSFTTDNENELATKNIRLQAGFKYLVNNNVTIHSSVAMSGRGTGWLPVIGWQNEDTKFEQEYIQPESYTYNLGVEYKSGKGLSAGLSYRNTSAGFTDTTHFIGREELRITFQYQLHGIFNFPITE
ncbi:MAG: helix-hairpin-helix domain-containing protein [Ignavibacteria bacterium]|nr:helix-hairpin-helix domain-containing protein [Ignavibacteria bacterium]